MSSKTADHSPQAAGHPPARRLVWLAGLSHATNHFVMLIFPAVLLLVREEFGLGYAGVGLLANVGLLCYGLGALPAGMLADRLGGERILTVWLLGGSLACLATGLAAGPLGLAAGLAALGAFGSLHHPAGSGLLVALRKAPGMDVGRAFGLSGVLGNVGLAASPLVAAAVGVRWGWRAAFLVGAVPGLLLGLVMLHHQFHWPHCRVRVGPIDGSHRPAYRKDFPLPLLILFAFETVMGFVFQGFSTFLPAYLAGRAGIAGLTAARVTRGGSLASLALLCGGAGHLVAGRLMSREHREAIFLGAVAVMTVGLAGMGIAAGIPLVVFSVIFAFSHFALGTISNTFIAVYTPPHLGGTAFGITFTLNFGVGSLASSIMGTLGERAGLPAIFLAQGAVSAAALGLITWFGHTLGVWPRRTVSATAPVGDTGSLGERSTTP